MALNRSSKASPVHMDLVVMSLAVEVMHLPATSLSMHSGIRRLPMTEMVKLLLLQLFQPQLLQLEPLRIQSLLRQPPCCAPTSPLMAGIPPRMAPAPLTHLASPHTPRQVRGRCTPSGRRQSPLAAIQIQGALRQPSLMRSLPQLPYLETLDR